MDERPKRAGMSASKAEAHLLFPSDSVAPITHTTEARLWFLQIIDCYPPAQIKVLGWLRDYVVGAYQRAFEEWEKWNPKEWRGVPISPTEKCPSPVGPAMKRLWDTVAKGMQDLCLTLDKKPADWMEDQIAGTLFIWYLASKRPGVLAGIDDPARNVDEPPHWPNYDGVLLRPRAVLPAHHRERERYEDWLKRIQKQERDLGYRPAKGLIRGRILTLRLTRHFRLDHPVADAKTGQVVTHEVERGSFRVPERMLRFVRHQVCGDDYAEIAGEGNRQTIYNACREMADLVELTNRHEKSGPVPESCTRRTLGRK